MTLIRATEGHLIDREELIRSLDGYIVFVFNSRLGLNRVSLGRKGFSSVFFVRFSVRSRTSSGGPFWTPQGPQNRLQIGPVAPARLGVAPGAVSGRPGEPPGPVLGSKTGGPDPHDSTVFFE